MHIYDLINMSFLMLLFEYLIMIIKNNSRSVVSSRSVAQHPNAEITLDQSYTRWAAIKPTMATCDGETATPV